MYRSRDGGAALAAFSGLRGACGVLVEEVRRGSGMGRVCLHRWLAEYEVVLAGGECNLGILLGTLVG